MTHVTAELFCDPYAVACWRYRPTLRHVEYHFPEVEWTVRPVVALPEPLDGDAAERYATDADRAARAAGLPLADDAFADGVPASWAACEALVAVREVDREGALALYHRLATRGFAEGDPTASADDLAALAAEVAAVDPDDVRAAVGSRRATATVGADLEAGRRLVARLPETEVRGEPSTLSLGPRTFGGEWPDLDSADRGAADSRDDEGADSTPDEADADSTADAGSPADDDAAAADDAGSTRAVPAPPLVRLRTAGYTVVVDPAKGHDEFADVLRTFDPDLGETDYSSKLHGRDVIRAYTIPKSTAEQMTSENYEPKVRAVLERLGDAFVPEIVRCTDLDPETCRRTLGELQTDGEVRRSREGTWHLVRDRTE